MNSNAKTFSAHCKRPSQTKQCYSPVRKTMSLSSSLIISSKHLNLTKQILLQLHRSSLRWTNCYAFYWGYLFEILIYWRIWPLKMMKWRMPYHCEIQGILEIPICTFVCMSSHQFVHNFSIKQQESNKFITTNKISKKSID